MNGPDKLKIRPESVLGIHPEVIKVFGEAVDRILSDLDEITDCMNIVALYFERKGLKEELFTEEELKDESDKEKDDTIPGVDNNAKQS